LITGTFHLLKKNTRKPTTVLLAELPGPFQLFFSKACRSALETAIQLAIEHNAELLIFHAFDYRLTEFDARHPKVVEIKQKMKQKFETEIKPYLSDFTNFKFGYSPTDPGLEICRIARQINLDSISIT
jgi:hypothetical protein